MPVVNFICPGCKDGYTLKVKNMDSVMSQVFRCPRCQYSCSFRNLINPAISPASPLHTHIAGTPGQKQWGKTKVSSATEAVTLLVEKSSRALSLSVGEYILGRDSVDSNANVKIAPDVYMSRQQAHLSVRNTSAGITCIITPIGVTNPVLVNDKPINNQGAILHNGDRIVLGITNVTIKM